MFLPGAHRSILLAEQEKNFFYLAHILGPTLAWERSAEAPDPLLPKAWHRCWRESLSYECTPWACNSPLTFAILRRSARSLPMFRADFLPSVLKTVEHSRYLPVSFDACCRRVGYSSSNPSRIRATSSGRRHSPGPLNLPVLLLEEHFSKWPNILMI